MTTTITTYTIHATTPEGIAANQWEVLGEAYGVVYTDRDDAEEMLASLRDDASDEDDLCHGIEYGIEETEHTLTLDLDSVEEYDDDEPSGYRVEYTADVEGDWCSQCEGITYPSREEAQAALEADPTAGPDCYGNECYPSIVECGDPRRELMAYVTATVRRSGRGRSETWTVGCMVGVPESEHGSARASGAMIRYGHYPTAWTIDASDLQVVPDWARDTVLELLDKHALEIWNRVERA